MRCCDCEFRKTCKETEPDTVAFLICKIRLGKLIDKELSNKIEILAKQVNEPSFEEEQE